jgi:hypothetical protein
VDAARAGNRKISWPKRGVGEAVRRVDVWWSLYTQGCPTM